MNSWTGTMPNLPLPPIDVVTWRSTVRTRLLPLRRHSLLEPDGTPLPKSGFRDGIPHPSHEGIEHGSDATPTTECKRYSEPGSVVVIDVPHVVDDLVGDVLGVAGVVVADLTGGVEVGVVVRRLVAGLRTRLAECLVELEGVVYPL